MKVQKTIKCKITDLTERKREALEREYKNLQKYLHENGDVELYIKDCSSTLDVDTR